MPSFVLYLLKLSISLCFVWVFYRLLLRNLTFYRMNRWYLLGYTLLCFVIPFINIGAGDSRESYVVQMIPTIETYRQLPADVLAGRSGDSINWWNVLLGVLSLGAFFLFFRLVLQGLALRRIRRNARRLENQELNIYEVDQDITPFSFAGAIYINPKLHSEKEWEEIILHEYVHVRQRHTVDILLMELVCVLNWYNPFAWLIRYSVRQNLEFIADEQVLRTGFDKKAYQYHLLKVIGQSRYQLANNFNFSSLKKRIIMMNRLRSARLHLVKFLFVLPGLVVLLLAFRNKLEAVEGMHVPPSLGLAKMAAHPEVVLSGMAPESVNKARPISKADTGKPAGVRQIVVVEGTGKGSDTGKPTVAIHRIAISDSSKELVVIDGVIRPGVKLNSISPDSIYAMRVLKGEDALTYYGEKGINGVVILTTKGFHERFATLDTRSLPEKTNPLYVVDGVPVSKDSMAKINPDDIEQIKVIKDSSARAIYGEKARDGVVFIVTKHGHKTTIRIKGTPSPLYIVDGKEMSKEAFEKDFTDADVVSMNVLKGTAVVAVYGEKGRNGVILITTKKGAKATTLNMEAHMENGIFSLVRVNEGR